MGLNNRYIKTKANYTLVKRHMKTYSGDILEHDHLTISSPYDSVYDKSVTMFSDSNFRFRIRDKQNEKKKHFTGNWLYTNDNSEYWTEADCNLVQTTENVIRIKPISTSLKDFAYFGSAVGLVKAAIVDIILHYPGGLYYPGPSGQTMEISGSTYYIIPNDFAIDLTSLGCFFNDEENPMRVLSASYDKYVYGTSENDALSSVVFTPDENGCFETITGTVTITSVGGASCTLYIYLNSNGEQVILSERAGEEGQPLIRPSDDLFDEMYDSLDDFSKVLLDYSTNPLFVAKFDTPHFNSEGRYWMLERYVFPSVTYVGQHRTFFSPRLNGNEYGGYIAKLLKLAQLIDEFEADNMIRMITHEAIINMDWTVPNSSSEENESNFDTKRMSAMLNVYGRQFDDLKRYADGIKSVNTITYNEYGNIPDYFLSDILERDGWDIPYVGPSEDLSIETDILYPNSMSVGYNSSDCNINFDRRLHLNSTFLQSIRGTRYGVNTILELLGMRNGATVTDQSINTATTAGYYEMHEHIAVAREFPSLININLAIENSDDYDETIGRYFDYPIAVIDNDNPLGGYVVPWFDKNNEQTSYMYFQMNGGWGHTLRKNINLSITSASQVHETENTSIYLETIQYLKYASTIDELTGQTLSTAYENMVCYVENIAGLYGNYVGDSDDMYFINNTSGECLSHYFILKNKNLSTFVGFVTPGMSGGRYNCYGWRNVLSHEFDGTGTITCDGMRVLYLESIESDTSGNNPHAGFGTYDDGMEYLEYFNKIFKHKLENGQFSLLSNDATNSLPISIDTVNNIGFNVDMDLVRDDTKCHYFISPIGVEIDMITPEILGAVEDNQQTNGDGETLITIGDELDNDMDLNNWDQIYTQFVSPLEPTSNLIEDTATEAAALSVINVKNTVINFITNGNRLYREYIQNVIIPILTQMIPSTTIFSYTFDGEVIRPIPIRYVNPGTIPMSRILADAAVPSQNEPLVEYDTLENQVETITEVEI